MSWGGFSEALITELANRLDIPISAQITDEEAGAVIQTFGQLEQPQYRDTLAAARVAVSQPKYPTIEI